MNNKLFTIIVNSSDGFEDCWNPFFTLETNNKLRSDDKAQPSQNIYHHHTYFPSFFMWK